MKKVVKITESDLNRLVTKILKEALEGDVAEFESGSDVRDAISNFNSNSSIDQNERMKEIQTALKKLKYNLGTTGPNRDGVDGKYGQLTYNAIVDFQRKNGIKKTGWVGVVTAPKLGVEPMVSGTRFVGKKQKPETDITKKDPQRQENINNVYCSVKGGLIKQPSSKFHNTKWSDWVLTYKPTEKELAIAKNSCGKIDKSKKYPCVGLSPEACKKISSTSRVTMGDAGTDQCAQFVSNNLKKLDPSYVTGNAWQGYSYVSAKGKGKYNIFKTGVDWNSIWSKLRENKITKSDCEKFANQANSDLFTIKSKSRAILDIAKSSVPQQSGVNLSELKPGDVVGLWHKNTDNSGRAFCERLINDLKLDDKGNFKKIPFSYNTHVGFVTTVKDGVPIIAHNVHGTYYTDPATKMLSKGDKDMIAWVASHNGVENAIAKLTPAGSTSIES
jgi:Putative peptidoglycan binding domain